MDHASGSETGARYAPILIWQNPRWGACKHKSKKKHQGERSASLSALLGQIAAYKTDEEGGVSLPVIDMLPQMVRAGDYDRHHSALRQMTTNASRVETFGAHVALRGSFKAGASAEMDVVRGEVTTAMFLQAFTDLDDEE